MHGPSSAPTLKSFEQLSRVDELSGRGRRERSGIPDSQKQNGCEESNVRQAGCLIYVVRPKALEFRAWGMIGGAPMPSGIIAMSGSVMIDGCREAAFLIMHQVSSPRRLPSCPVTALAGAEVVMRSATRRSRPDLVLGLDGLAAGMSSSMRSEPQRVPRPRSRPEQPAGRVAAPPNAKIREGLRAAAIAGHC